MDLQARPGRTPSEMVARLWTVLGIFIPVVLPVAVLYQRRARREAEQSDGQLVWRRTLGNRPVVVCIVAWTAFLVLMFLLFAVASALGIMPMV